MPDNTDKPSNPLPTREAGKTVYFLGAGFSAAAGIPMMPHFVRESFRLLKRYGSDKLTEKFAEIVTEYRHIAASTGIDIDDIQELFSLVSGGHPKQPGQSNGDHARCIRAVIAHTICFAHLEDQRWFYRKSRNIIRDQIIDQISPDKKLLLKDPKPKKYQDVKADQVKVNLGKLDRDDLFDYWDNRDKRSSEDMWAWRTVPKRHIFPLKDQSRIVSRNNIFGNSLNYCVYQAFLSYMLHRSKIEENKYQDVIITPNCDY